MDFDFITLYRNYSNTDLLKILLHPDQYQPEAVQVAGDLLAMRNVTDDERRAAGYIISDPVPADDRRNMTQHPSVAIDLLGSFDEKNESHPVFFMTGFILICLYYLRSFYFSSRDIYYYFKFGPPPFVLIFIDTVYLFVVPIALIMFYRRKKAGWFILFVESCLTFVPVIYYSAGSVSRIFSHFSINAVLSLLDIIMKPLTIYFLWDKVVAGHAGITMQEKKTTAIVCIIIVIAIGWLIHMMNSHTGF